MEVANLWELIDFLICFPEYTIPREIYIDHIGCMMLGEKMFGFGIVGTKRKEIAYLLSLFRFLFCLSFGLLALFVGGIAAFKFYSHRESANYDIGTEVEYLIRSGETLAAMGVINEKPWMLQYQMPDRGGLSGGSFLHIAAASDNIEAADSLLGKGIGIDVRRTSSQANAGTTPMHDAAFNSRDKMISFLCSRGADVNASDSSGKTPLFYASARSTLELLISLGSSITQEDRRGRVPLFYATTKEAKG